MELTLDQALQKGIEAHKRGKVQEADGYYTAILKVQPKHPDANHNMGVLAVSVGKVQESLPFFKMALEANSGIKQFWLSYIDALIKLNRRDDAKVAFFEAQSNGAKGEGFEKLEQILDGWDKPVTSQTLNTQDPPQNYLDGLIDLYENGQLQKVVENCLNMLEKYPVSPSLYNIKGVAYAKLNLLDKALESYKIALSMTPDYAEAHMNIGVTLEDMGRFDDAVAAYCDAIIHKPNFMYAKQNLANLLKTYSPKGVTRNPLILIDNEIKSQTKELHLNKNNQDLALYISRVIKKIENADKNIRTNHSQIYRQNRVDLNCNRHLALFSAREVISEFCFGCYKVQVEVNSILDLIRLTSLFYSINFDQNYTRKCMVETRPAIKGIYKGLVFCRDFSQAKKIKKLLDENLTLIDSKLLSKIKKGCSEFPLIYPRYNELDKNGQGKMRYLKNWKSVENEFDKQYSSTKKVSVIPSLWEFCLSDFLVIHKWIDYAKGANDNTSSLFGDLPIKYKEIFSISEDRRK